MYSYSGPTQLRAGLIGGGAWAERAYCPTLSADPSTDFAGIWTRRTQSAERLASAFGVRAFTTLEDLLTNVEAVALAVAPTVQCALALRAVECGRHILVEKPLALRSDQARELLRTVRERGVVARLALGFRAVPEVAELLSSSPERASSGRVELQSGAHLRGPYRDGWRDEVGPLADIGPHALDLLERGCGPIVRLETHRRGRLVTLRCEHRGGARGLVTLSDEADVDGTDVRLRFTDDQGDRQLHLQNVRPAQHWASVWDDFVEQVRRATPGATGLLPDVDYAGHLVSLVGAAGMSARDSRPVDVPPESMTRVRHDPAAAIVEV